MSILSHRVSIDSSRVFSGETPLHIAIVYNDIESVKLLIKHGVDVNKRVVGDFTMSAQKRAKDETKRGRRKSTRLLAGADESARKQFNPQTENPESN